MNTSRLEAFSDGVIAIIITIMVLELKVPHESDLAGLRPLIPVFLAYILSFITIGTYWNNHHHLLKVAKIINSKIMWANLHLLFWLSLIPFFTGWLGENYTKAWPTALYGVFLLCAAFAYQILQRTIVIHHGKNSELHSKLGQDIKGKISLACYILAILFAFINYWVSDILYTSVALMWLIPDRRLEIKAVKS